MNGMGDIRYDPEAMLRRIGTTVVSEDLGRMHARIEAVHRRRGGGARRRAPRALRDGSEAAPRQRHAYAARFEIALRAMLEDGGYAGFSFHFDAIGGDGRFRQLPILAASNLMADGYGYAAEGDTNTATLMCAAQAMIGDAHFSEMYAMDWERDSVLISHMGEGNWRVARTDRPVRLIDRALGIGGLDNPPTPVFAAVPGRATTAALIPIEGDYYRLLVGHGEVLDTPELPACRDAQLPLPARRRDGAVHGRLAAPRRAAPLRDHARRARRSLASSRRAARARLRGDLTPWRRGPGSERR